MASCTHFIADTNSKTGNKPTNKKRIVVVGAGISGLASAYYLIKKAKEESLAQFVCRRLGQEALEHIAEPLIGAIYGGNHEYLSAAWVTPHLVVLEKQHGSLFAVCIPPTILRPCQHQVGHKALLTEIKSLVSEVPHLTLAGNAFSGTGIPDCINSGKLAVRKVLSELYSKIL